MFPPADIRLLNVKRIRWFSVLPIVSFDINWETYSGIDVMVVLGCIIIDIVLPILSVLDSICDDLCSRIIAWDHSPGSIDYDTRKGKTMRYDVTRFSGVAFVRWH